VVKKLIFFLAQQDKSKKYNSFGVEYQWKLLNIKKMDKGRHQQQIELLKKALQL